MTEGAPAALATWEDVQSRWRPLSPAEQGKATIRIGDASAELRRRVPGLDARITADTSGDLALVATSKVVDAVLRFVQNPEGAKQLQETIGPRSYGMTFDGKATGIFFTDDELAALQPSAGSDRSSTALGTAFMDTRPGWAPIAAPGAGWWPC